MNLSQLANLAGDMVPPGRRHGRIHRRRSGTKKGGFCSGVFGLILGVVLLFWNEGRSVKRYAMIQEGIKSVVSVSDTSTVNSKNEGKLVILSGPLTTTDSPLNDSSFGVEQEALLMDRQVAMYQWTETKKQQKKDDKTITTYSYSKGWYTTLKSSSSFHEIRGHSNPTSMKFSSYSIVADPWNLGIFTIAPDMKRKLRSSKPLAGLNTDDLPSGTTQAEAKSGGDSYYYGSGSSSFPQVGDTKVSYTYLPVGGIFTILAKQTGASFEGYQTKSGGKWYEIRQGKLSAEELFAQAQADNKSLTLILRVIGFFLLFVGCNNLFAPIISLAAVTPCFGAAMAECLAGTIIPFVCFILAGGIFGVVVGCAWLFYRPLLSIPLLVGISVGGYYGWLAYKNNRDNSALTEDTNDEYEYDDLHLGSGADGEYRDEETVDIEMKQDGEENQY